MRKCPGEYLAAFLFGFFAYGLIEICGRGYTHWSMGFLGGMAFVILYSMRLPHLTAAFFGMLFITACEFTAGVLENLMLGWAIWDYTERPFNLLGQICPLFSALWFLLSFAATFLCSAMQKAYSTGT